MSCLHVRPVTSVCFDIGIPYLAQGSITIRGYVKFTHDPMTSWSNLKGLWAWPLTPISKLFFTMDLSLARCLRSLTYAYQIFAYGCITMRQHVVYILDLRITFDIINIIKWLYLIHKWMINSVHYFSKNDNHITVHNILAYFKQTCLISKMKTLNCYAHDMYTRKL